MATIQTTYAAFYGPDGSLNFARYEDSDRLNNLIKSGYKIADITTDRTTFEGWNNTTTGLPKTYAAYLQTNPNGAPTWNADGTKKETAPAEVTPSTADQPATTDTSTQPTLDETLATNGSQENQDYWNTGTQPTTVGTNVGTGQTEPVAASSPSSTGTTAPTTTTEPSISGGSSTSIPTSYNSANTLLAGYNQLHIPTLNSDSLSGATVNGLIDAINQQKDETYARSALLDFKDPVNLNKVFSDPAGTTYKLENGTYTTKEEILSGNNFKDAALTGGFKGSIQLNQPLENYKAFVDAGIPIDMIQVEPLPPISLTEVELPDTSQFYNNQEGTQIGRGEVSPVDTLQQMPDQTKTDITGMSEQ